MKKVLRVFGLTVLGLVIVGTFYLLWKKSHPDPVEYEVLRAERKNIEMVSVATGTVVPRDEVLIKPQISGIISELRKEAGEQVKTGDVIAVVKVIPEMASLNSAESQVKQAQISLTQVKAEYERQKALFDKGVVTASDMDQATANYAKAKENLETAQNNLDIVRDGISRKLEQQSNTQIRSTITGMILDVPVKVGNSVIQSNTFNDGTTIASVADMNDMIFDGQVDETEVGRIHAGMPIKLTIGAINDLKFDATLEYIAPKGVETNGAIQFEIKAAARIPDTITVRAGYSANAEIVLARADSVLTVPESALTFSGDTTFVHVLTDSLSVPKRFVRKPIKTGLSDGIFVEVKEGLSEGEKIRGNEKTAHAEANQANRPGPRRR